MDFPCGSGALTAGVGRAGGRGWSWPVPPGSGPHGWAAPLTAAPTYSPSLMGCGFLSLGHTMVWGWGGAVTLKPSTAPESKGLPADPHPWTLEYQEGPHSFRTGLKCLLLTCLGSAHLRGAFGEEYIMTLLDKGTCMSPSSVHCCGNFLGAGRPDTNLPPEKGELPLPGPGAHLGSSSQLGGRGGQNPKPVAVPVTTVRPCWAGTSGAVGGTPCHPPPPHGLRARQMPAQA